MHSALISDRAENRDDEFISFSPAVCLILTRAAVYDVIFAGALLKGERVVYAGVSVCK